MLISSFRNFAWQHDSATGLWNVKVKFWALLSLEGCEDLPSDPDAPTPSFKEFSQKLQSQFGAEGEPFQVLLDSCSRKTKESINDLKGRVIELVDKTYPSVSIDKRKDLYVGPFIRVFSDEGQR